MKRYTVEVYHPYLREIEHLFDADTLFSRDEISEVFEVDAKLITIRDNQTGGYL